MADSTACQGCELMIVYNRMAILQPKAPAGLHQQNSTTSLLDLIVLSCFAAMAAGAAGELLMQAPTPLRAGRLVCELFDKEVPKAAENFKCLCTGERGLGKSSKKPLHYKGTKFHRIEPGFCCQGGDVVRGG